MGGSYLIAKSSILLNTPCPKIKLPIPYLSYSCRVRDFSCQQPFAVPESVFWTIHEKGEKLQGSGPTTSPGHQIPIRIWFPWRAFKVLTLIIQLGDCVKYLIFLLLQRDLDFMSYDFYAPSWQVRDNMAFKLFLSKILWQPILFDA